MAPKTAPKVSAAKQNKSTVAPKKRKEPEPVSEPFEQQEEPPAKRPTVGPKMRTPQVPLPFPEPTGPAAPPIAGPSPASAPAIPINPSNATDSVRNEPGSRVVGTNRQKICVPPNPDRARSARKPQ
ncbi:hypothetical protein BDV93DRAFT_555169 [Ceratobasidium sp. AG-I]|nr:hypothetical protein BDV93DRAFT_555169 [Ceratobasidium sp. AG-I]